MGADPLAERLEEVLGADTAAPVAGRDLPDLVRVLREELVLRALLAKAIEELGHGWVAQDRAGVRAALPDAVEEGTGREARLRLHLVGMGL